MKTETRVWLAALAFWIVVSALTWWLYPLTMTDSCQRYAPMADAFARGDFYYAFHPRFGIIFEVIAGGLSLVTGLPGCYAVQSAAFLFLAFAAVVMFFFARRLGGSNQIAWWTFALTLVAPDFFRYALDGLRDPSKCLVFALVGYAMAARLAWPFALALFIYITSYTYGFAASSVFVFLWCLWFAWKRDWKMLPAPIAAWVLGTAIMTFFTHAYTGHWLPAPQFIDKLGAWL